MTEKELMEYIGSRISEFRKKNKLTQSELGNKIGVKNNTISAYERGAISTDQDILFKLARVFDVSIDDFFPDRNVIKEETSEYFTENNYNYFPTYISAGLPNEVDGITEPDKIKISDEIMGKYAGNKDIFITRINGDSMNKVIPHDSLIAVRPVSPETLKNGDIVVYKYDSEYAVKRFYKQDNKVIFRPDSNNLSFTDLVIDLEHNDLDIKIKGKVVLYIVELDWKW